MLTLRITVLITVIVSLNYEFCFCGCAHAEYEIDGQCCPMCAPGNRVLWHCTEYTSTTCVPCPELTYIDEPSGFTKCFTCTVCDDGRGLRVNKACTRSSDTVCGPLKGFYCTERNKGSCRFAVKHSECSPGQYIKQAGTGSTDTVCADCKGDTYSNGSFLSCLTHTKCEALGLTETNPGTKSSDSECGNPPALAIIISSVIVTLIIIFTVVFTIIHIRKKKHSKHSGIQETGNYLNEKASTKVVGGRTNDETFGMEEQVLSLQNVNDCSSQTTQNCLHIL